ncbi:MAG: hypothetical protein FJ253_11570 [Phycisphaerae bacterium]|nr:hypothetical protein [Phycisphaerae bacterium]
MQAILFGVLAGVAWGVGELCTKLVLRSGQVGPVSAIAVRTAVALPLLVLAWFAATRGLLEPLGVAASREPAWWRADTKTLLLLILGSGLSAGALGVGFFYLGIAAGDLSKVKPIAFSLAPAIAVVLAWMILGEAMSVRKIASVAMILAGVVLLTTAA